MWACVKTLNKGFGIVYALVFSLNGEMLATGGDDEKIRVYNVSDDFSRMPYAHNGGTYRQRLFPLLLPRQ